MLEATLLTAAVAFFIWHCCARVRPPGIAQLVPRLPDPAQKFLGCPWCFGAWACLAVALLQVRAWPDTLIVWWGAAALVGIVGSQLPDDGEVD